MADLHSFRTPVARLVGGSVSKAREVMGNDGKPRLDAQGNKMRDYSFGVAIPKTPGATHWSQEAWGAPIYQLAQQSWPNGEFQRPDFSWKITDGDSTIPNKRGKKPCDQEGYAGHWVIWYSGSLPPRYYTMIGSNEPQVLADPSVIENGYYVQVYGNTRSNAPSQSPGMYMNHSMVCLIAYGERIVSGPDVSQAGFGTSALPPGASVTPPAAFTPPVVPPAQPAIVTPPVVVAPAPAILTPPVPPVQPAIVTPPVVVAPAPAILTPPVPPVQPAKQLTAAANGATYEQLIAAGWTDATLIQHGLMLA